jgi:hypothetical protein
MRIARWLGWIACCTAAHAAGQGASAEVPMLDPWVPPATAKAAETLPKAKRGADLRAEVERKLRADFDAAAPQGTLTRDQARAAGLGFIANHFEAIDRRGAGAVRFEDYAAFLRSRGGFLP